jgi:hypothetical protein
MRRRAAATPPAWDAKSRCRTRNGRPTLSYCRDEQAITARQPTASGDQHPRPTRRQRRPDALQRPADRRATPPRCQADTQSPPDLPTQRRPHPRSHTPRRDRTADLRRDPVTDPPRTRPRRAATRPTARRTRRQAHQTSNGTLTRLPAGTCRSSDRHPIQATYRPLRHGRARRLRPARSGPRRARCRRCDRPRERRAAGPRAGRRC